MVTKHSQIGAALRLLTPSIPPPTTPAAIHKKEAQAQRMTHTYQLRNTLCTTPHGEGGGAYSRMSASLTERRADFMASSKCAALISDTASSDVSSSSIASGFLARRFSFSMSCKRTYAQRRPSTPGFNSSTTPDERHPTHSQPTQCRAPSLPSPHAIIQA